MGDAVTTDPKPLTAEERRQSMRLCDEIPLEGPAWDPWLGAVERTLAKDLRRALAQIDALVAERDEARDLLRRARHACLVEMEPWDEDDETITGANAAAARILGVLGDTP